MHSVARHKKKQSVLSVYIKELLFSDQWSYRIQYTVVLLKLGHSAGKVIIQALCVIHSATADSEAVLSLISSVYLRAAATAITKQ